jgi:hypothetical protein
MSVLLDYSTQFLLAADGLSSTRAHDNIPSPQAGDGFGQAGLAQNPQNILVFRGGRPA